MKILTLFFLLSVGLRLNAQSATDSVKFSVNRLFSAMRQSDAQGIRLSFSDSAILQTMVTVNRQGKLAARDESISEFALLIGKLPKDSADERIVFDVIRIDGPMAIVWAPYQFYYNGKFSHCGVDNFTLIRTNGEWKIQYLIDTRRKGGCAEQR